MKEKKDYEKLNEELLGVLAGTDGEIAKHFVGGQHSADYYVTQAVVNELATQAPEVLDSIKRQHLIVADSPNALIGKLVKYLVKTIDLEQSSDGKWRLTVPTWE